MGTLIPTQVFIVDMLDNPGANVLNIASMSSYHAITKSKCILLPQKPLFPTLQNGLQYIFAKSGIRVNALAPGWFETVQNKTLLRNPDGSLSERSKKVLAPTPMGRFGVPEDLTGTIVMAYRQCSIRFCYRCYNPC